MILRGPNFDGSRELYRTLFRRHLLVRFAKVRLQNRPVGPVTVESHVTFSGVLFRRNTPRDIPRQISSTESDSDPRGPNLTSLKIICKRMRSFSWLRDRFMHAELGLVAFIRSRFRSGDNRRSFVDSMGLLCCRLGARSPIAIGNRSPEGFPGTSAGIAGVCG